MLYCAEYKKQMHFTENQYTTEFVMLKHFQKSKRMHLLTVGMMFAVMLILNVLTQKLSDDFLYVFSIATGARLGTIGEIVESIIAHGEGVNGRYFAHFFAQFFLTLPDIVFDVVNAAVFVATIYTVYRICNKDRETNNLFLIGIFGFVWLFEHSFGQVNLWLDGACNYLFAVFFGLLFIIPFLNSLMYGKQLHILLIIPHMLLSVLLGGYLEPLSVGFVCAACLFIPVDFFYYKNKQALRLVPSVLCSFFGLALMAFAPAEHMNKLSSFSILKFLEIFGIALFVVASIFPIILIYIALFKRLRKENVDKRVLVASLILAVGAFVSNFILLIANNYPLRCSVAFVFLSVFATALLYGNLKDRDFGEKAKKYYRLFAVTLCLAIAVAFADNICTFVCIKQNEQTVAEAIDQGEGHVELDIPLPFTKYNALQGIVYLDRESVENWPNTHVAKYYGLDSVIGKAK